MFLYPIPSLNHPNVLSYIDVLRRDVDIGDRVAIIRAGGIGFDTKIWMEYLGVDGTNETSAGAAAAVPYKRHRERRQKRQNEGGGEEEAYRPDAEKGWQAGKPGKDYGMDPQGGVGQEG